MLQENAWTQCCKESLLYIYRWAFLFSFFPPPQWRRHMFSGFCSHRAYSSLLYTQKQSKRHETEGPVFPLYTIHMALQWREYIHTGMVYTQCIYTGYELTAQMCTHNAIQSDDTTDQVSLFSFLRGYTNCVGLCIHYTSWLLPNMHSNMACLSKFST